MYDKQFEKLGLVCVRELVLWVSLVTVVVIDELRWDSKYDFQYEIMKKRSWSWHTLKKQMLNGVYRLGFYVSQGSDGQTSRDVNLGKCISQTHQSNN